MNHNASQSRAIVRRANAEEHEHLQQLEAKRDVTTSLSAKYGLVDRGLRSTWFCLGSPGDSPEWGMLGHRIWRRMENIGCSRGNQNLC